ncbi:MAG: helix-turn-helix domain-containing protein [Fibrobacteraceae bacterium]|nr:helix-turn-helix domain-containing protein [Fibrobacteraceae bacterium]
MQPCQGATFSSPKTDIKKLTHSESEIIKSGIELEAGIPANEICNRLNISRPTLYQWKRIYFKPVLKMG